MKDIKNHLIEEEGNKEEKRSYKGLIAIIVIILLFNIAFSINLGYAYIYNADENISTAGINGKFEMLFDNAKIKDNNGAENASIEISDDMKKLYLNGGELQYPGAKVDYTVEIFNNSKVVTKIQSVECNGIDNTGVIRLEGLDKIDENVILNPGERYNLDLRIKWDDRFDAAENEKANFEININFEQVI